MQLHEALEQIDGMMDLVNTLILQNQPEATQQAISQLREAMQAFVGLAPRFGAVQFTPDNVEHMRAISERIGAIRAHIVKMGALTAQQLNALMPQQAQVHTYGGTGSKPAGGAASVARMYHISG